MIFIKDDKIIEEGVNRAVQFLGLSKITLTAQKTLGLCGFSLKKKENCASGVAIKYGEPCDLFRALLYISQNGVDNVSKRRNFEKLGYMIDVARDAVPKIGILKKMVLYLAVLGYSRLYLYLEDIFEVSDEPFFGYLRGRYSEQELKELDDYCADFGIELVPCIQTLAHLNGIFKWQEYKKCNDIADILLAGDQRTYHLIENMFQTISRVFRSKTLHIGMDEAQLVGRGKYLDKNGYKCGCDVVANHLAKIIEIAKPFEFNLMIWSDMYFRLAFGGGYYSADGILPEDIRRLIPSEISLVYWDYYNRDESLVKHMIEEHLKTGNNVAFAGGAWKWNGINPDTEMSFLTAKTALSVCKQYGIKDIMLTAWGDDGAEASLFSSLPVIVYYAESCYTQGEVTEQCVDTQLNKLWNLRLESFFAADMLIVDKSQFKENYLFWKLPKMLLYNDPLCGMYDWIVEKYDVLRGLSLYGKRLKHAVDNAPSEFKYIFKNVGNFCSVLELKATLGRDIRKAYQAKHIEELDTIASKRIPRLIRRIKKFEKGFFEQWMYENKDNGYQTHDNRLWGLIKRLITTKKLIEEYIAGKREEIYQMRDELLTIDGEDALNIILW